MCKGGKPFLFWGLLCISPTGTQGYCFSPGSLGVYILTGFSRGDLAPGVPPFPNSWLWAFSPGVLGRFWPPPFLGAKTPFVPAGIFKPLLGEIWKGPFYLGIFSPKKRGFSGQFFAAPRGSFTIGRFSPTSPLLWGLLGLFPL